MNDDPVEYINLLCNNNNVELVDLYILIIIIQKTLEVINETNQLHITFIETISKCIERRCYNKKHSLPRRNWSEIYNVLPDKLFRRMFRMKKEWFNDVRDQIIETIGEEIFKTEHYLEENAKLIPTTEACNRWGGIVSVEIKLAITIRMLAGASYLDLILSYGIKSAEVYKIFHECKDWINLSFKFPLVDYIKTEDLEALRGISDDFSSRSNGVFTGCIGAIDGLAVRIRCPSSTVDGIEDCGNYYCRKGFYALNIQAICDSHKRIIWLSSGHKGSIHDSAAFAETLLIDLLKLKSEFLYKNRLFLIGDSAYTLASYLITPHDNADSQSMEDDFNYYHSSCRINIECSFGEIIMRWGIFWRKLQFSLKETGKIINAAVLLHNFLIDKRDGTIESQIERTYFANFNIDEEDNRTNAEVASPLVTDNNEPHRGGRPTIDDRGKEIRNTLTVMLRTHELHRFLNNGTTFNRHGHVYMTY